MLIKQKKLVTSGPTFIYWLLYAAFDSIEVLTIDFENVWATTLSFLKIMGVFSMLLLNCFADFKKRPSALLDKGNASPEETSSFFSKILFSWFIAFAWKGYNQPMQ